MFAYCGNDPINRIDPTGEIPIATLILIGSAIWGALNAGYTAYASYQAGWELDQILWYTFGAGLGGFLTAYSLGTSLYQVYLQYCMICGITPVTNVSFSTSQTNVDTSTETNASASTHTSKGSTATRQPQNLTEQLALEEVKSNPQGKQLPITMNDPRWPASDGWVKMQQKVSTSKGNVIVHYVWNSITNEFDDFKLK